MRHTMRLAALVSSAFLLASASAAAQSAGYGTAQVEKIDPPYGHRSIPSYNGSIAVWQNVDKACPVSVRAQHGADGTMRQVDKNRPEGIAQKLHLTLTDKDPRQIIEARLRVRGVSAKGRVSRTDMTPNGMDYMRNVTVKLQQSADNEATGDVWVPGMTAVLQVELSSVTFADGSMQWFGATQGCRFTPDHLMLVAADSN
jgi:hypothetical protein